MTLAECITQISTWTWTELKSNLVLDDFDGKLPASKLPALVLTLSGTGGEGYQPQQLGGSAIFVIHITHFLINKGLGQGLYGLSANDMVADFDNYAAEVNNDPTLNSKLREPMLVELVSTAPIELAGFRYQGLTFRHRWVVKY